MLVVLVLNPVIAHVPVAALGAVLIGTSYRIASPANLKELLQTTKLDSITLLITAAMVVVIGLIWAIALSTAGYILATIVIAQRRKRAVAKGSYFRNGSRINCWKEVILQLSAGENVWGFMALLELRSLML